MRINESYQKMFPNNCPVIEVTGDGVEVGTCTYYMPNGVCPRHGRLLTQRAADVCPVCAGKRHIQTKSRGLVKCASCNGTGQRG